jgi:hypothetical protein
MLSGVIKTSQTPEKMNAEPVPIVISSEVCLVLLFCYFMNFSAKWQATE